MRDLSELITLLGPNTPLCTHFDAIESTDTELLRLLQKNPRLGGEEAAAHFNLDPASPEFAQLKDRLKIRLIDAVTALERHGNVANRRDREFNYVWKVIAVAKQLRKRARGEVVLPQLEHAFRIAEEMEFVQAAYFCAGMLRRQYTNRNFDAEKYLYYRDRTEYHRSVSRDYEDILAAVNEIFYLRNTKGSDDAVRSLARDQYERYAYCIADYDSTMVSYLVYLLEINIYLVDNDYSEVIRIATEALAYLDARPQALPTMYQVFEANLSIAYTQLNDYTRGMAFAQRMLSKTTPGEHNYFKVYELMLILALRDRKFQTAYDIYYSFLQEDFAANLMSYYRETFRIIEAYLYLLVRLGQITPVAGDNTFGRFRIKRFLNSFEHVTSEKSHRNVHLLIIQLVDQLIDGQHQKSALSIEAITKYAQRHLRGKGYERVRFFLKALAQLAEQGFHRAAVERHTEKYVRALSRHQIEEDQLDYYMELIPYNALWKLLLEQLGYQRVKLRKR